MYAIKRIALQHAHCVGGNERVLREVKLLSRLADPLIVRYFNAFVEEASTASLFPYIDPDANDDFFGDHNGAEEGSTSALGRLTADDGADLDDHSALHSDSIFRRLEPSVEDSVTSDATRGGRGSRGTNGISSLASSAAGAAKGAIAGGAFGGGAHNCTTNMPDPSMECNICHQFYADWSVRLCGALYSIIASDAVPLTFRACARLLPQVSFPEWLLIEGSLQALSLCVDCYLKQLVRGNVLFGLDCARGFAWH
jgi:hypothetical protein